MPRRVDYRRDEMDPGGDGAEDFEMGAGPVGGRADPRRADAPGVNVHLGQSFVPREPTYERVMLTDWLFIRQKFQDFGYLHDRGGDEGIRAYEHMRSVTREYMMSVASQVPTDEWRRVQGEVIAWWRNLDVERDQEWHIPIAMGEIGNIMFNVGLGLTRRPRPTKWNLSREETNVAWFQRLQKDRERRLAAAVMSR